MIEEGKANSFGLFLLNLLVLLFCGVGVLYWIGYHSEYLGVVGGLLGLGGVFAWVAFIFGVIREDRKIQMRFAFDRFLTRPGTTVFCLALAVALLITGSLFGSFEIDCRRDGADRFVEIVSTNTNPGEVVREGAVLAGSVSKFPVFAGWGGRNYILHVDGLPRIEEPVSGFSRSVVRVPNRFYSQNVVLIRPNNEVCKSAKKEGIVYRLYLKIDGKEIDSLQPYRGQSFWLGCKADVTVPETLRERWRLELIAQGLPDANHIAWLQTGVLAEGRSLERDDLIEVELKNTDGFLVARGEVAVRECGNSDCFPQEVILAMVEPE